MNNGVIEPVESNQRNPRELPVWAYEMLYRALRVKRKEDKRSGYNPKYL